MNIGIIGSEEKKFTPQTKEAAKIAILECIQKATMLNAGVAPSIVSGRCHLGGVDIWAEEAADALGLPKAIFPPEVHSWEPTDKDKKKGKMVGYKQRNIKIANASDILYVIVVARLPEGYPPEPWNRKPCYHCTKHPFIPDAGGGHRVSVPGADGYWVRHIKSGACWTAWYAIEQLHKEARWIII